MAPDPEPKPPKNGGAVEGGLPPDLLPPLTVPIEEFVRDDRAVQARALAHLVAMMEQPITRRQPRSGVVQIEPNLARIRVEIAKHLSGLIVEPPADVADPAPSEGARGTAAPGSGEFPGVRRVV